MSLIAAEAKPLSRKQIRDYSTRLRGWLGLDREPYVDVERLVDIVLPSVIPAFHYDVRTKGEMGDKHGEADPSDMRISLREDVYQGMVNGVGRDRFTTMHEVAHLLLHQPDRIILNRTTQTKALQAFRDPEWQANCLAGEFLGSHLFLSRYSNCYELADAVGLSYQAAEVQWSAFRKDGLVKNF